MNRGIEPRMYALEFGGTGLRETGPRQTETERSESAASEYLSTAKRQNSETDTEACGRCTKAVAWMGWFSLDSVARVLAVTEASRGRGGSV
jgi:hypothetical protein